MLPLLLLSVLTFAATDRALTHAGFQGVYYAVHSLHNLVMVYLTWEDLLAVFTNLSALGDVNVNTNAAAICFALHFYHIALYASKFRFDDWLHHILMIFIALPIGLSMPVTPLLGYSLFFTTGLPGMIDYALLFGVRNGWVDRLTEKQINGALNVWIRSPGCASHAAFTVAYIISNSGPQIALLAPTLTYWNGQYFMRQIVEDTAEQLRVKHKESESI